MRNRSNLCRAITTLCFVLLFGLSGCFSKQEIFIPISSEIERLNPRRVLTMEAKEILSAIYSTLFEFRGTHPEPKLIDTWSFEPIEKKYIFKLKDGILFHDGTELTSDDVIFSIHQWAAEDSLDSHLLRDIKGVAEYQKMASPFISGIHRVDRSRFTVDMLNSSADFISTLCLPRFVVQKADFNHQSEEQYFAKPIGTGPFFVKNFSGSELALSRFSKYFAKPARSGLIVIKRVGFQDAIEKFNAKYFDLLLFYSLVDISLITRKDTVVEILPSVSTISLVFPQNVAQHLDLSFRERVGYFIKQSKLLSKCVVGNEKFVSFLPPGFLNNIDEREPEADTEKNLLDLKSNVSVYLTHDLWSRCFQSDGAQRGEGSLIFKSGEMSDLYALFNKGKLGPFIEEFNFKNDDPMTVLQYFEPNTPEYLLARPIPELVNLFQKIRHSKDPAEKNAYMNLVFHFLEANHLVTPLSHPKNIRIYSDNLEGASQYSVFRQSQNWETLGY
ncbi:MAG: ABC transporter substrate-binding protein [Candidatus Omnitrophica bacterium]|nr:ABC transporter substrate-binding protein [Candidatus Omnitrophota bacterium]